MHTRLSLLVLFSSCFLLVSEAFAQAPEVGVRWETLASVPEARTEVAVSTDGRGIYLLAGFVPPPSGTIVNGEVPVTREVLRYDPATDSWDDAGRVPVATHHTALVNVGERLYLLGGYEGSGFQPRSSTWIYDPRTNEWSEGAPMPTPRGAMAAAVLEEKIHIIGGTVSNSGALDPSQHTVSERDGSVGTHEVYDPATDTWERLAPMPTPRNHHVAGAIEDRIYVTGGRVGARGEGSIGMTVTEVYDPATDTWSEGPALPTGRSGMAGAVVDGRFFVFGGETDGGDALSTYIVGVAEYFDPAQNVWERLPSMPSSRHGLGAAVVDGRIYLVAGGSRPAYSFGSENVRLVFP